MAGSAIVAVQALVKCGDFAEVSACQNARRTRSFPRVRLWICLVHRRNRYFDMRRCTDLDRTTLSTSD